MHNSPFSISFLYRDYIYNICMKCEWARCLICMWNAKKYNRIEQKLNKISNSGMVIISYKRTIFNVYNKRYTTFEKVVYLPFVDILFSNYPLPSVRHIQNLFHHLTIYTQSYVSFPILVTSLGHISNISSAIDKHSHNSPSLYGYIDLLSIDPAHWAYSKRERRQ